MYRLGVGYVLLNRRDEGRKTLRAGASLAHDAGDKAIEADALNDLALNISREGGYAEAITLSDHALRLKMEAGDRRGEGDVQNIRAIIQQNAGFLDDAAARNTRALALRVEIGDEAG